MAFVKVKIPRNNQPQDACGLDASSGVSTAWSATNAEFELVTGDGAMWDQRYGSVVPTSHGLAFKNVGQFAHVSVPATRPDGRFLLVTAFTNATSVASEIIASTKDYWNQPDGFFVGSKDNENTLEISGGGGGFPQITMPGLGAAGAYHCLVVEFEGTTATGYLDGVRMGAVAITPVNPFKDNRMGIGTYSNNANADSRRLYHLTALVTQGDPISLSANPWQIFDTEELTIWVQDTQSTSVDNLIPKNISFGATTLGVAVLGQTHTLAEKVINLSSVNVSSASISQVHQLVAKAVNTGAFTLSKPTLLYAPTVVDLVGSTINLGTTTITKPTIVQVHALIAQSVSIGSLSVSSPTIAQKHTIIGKNLAFSSVVVTPAVISQVHTLIAKDINLGVISVSSPDLTSVSNVDNLSGKDVVLEALQIVKSSIEQIQVLTGLNVDLNGLNIVKSVIGQVHVLTVQPITLSPIAISKPGLVSLANTDALSPKDITLGAIAASSPAITQIHILVANPLATGAVSVVKPILGQVHGLAPKGIDLGPLVITNPVLTSSAIVGVYPLPEQVLIGITYGPTGTEYTGTLVVGAGVTVYIEQILSEVVDDKIIVLLPDEVIQSNILSETT